MTRSLHVFHEPVPAYMERLLLMGCRFVEGNTGAGDPPADPASTPDPPKDPASEAGKGEGDEPLGEPGKKALESERTARKAAEKRASEAEQRAQAAEAKLNPPSTANKDETGKAQEPATGTPAGPSDSDRELWLYKALVAHPVPAEHRHLVKGDTEEEYKAAAESVSQLAARPGVVNKSGTTGDNSPTGTSVATGRDLFRSRHNRSRKD